jgi:hypothetical protein
MEDREWMYTGRVRRNDVTPDWIRKTDAFVERAYGEAAKGASLVPCPCSKCDNRKRKYREHFFDLFIYRRDSLPDQLQQHPIKHNLNIESISLIFLYRDFLLSALSI